jgi:hypothetical protein
MDIPLGNLIFRKFVVAVEDDEQISREKNTREDNIILRMTIDVFSIIVFVSTKADVGEVLRDRFSASKEESLWFCQSMADALCTFGEDSRCALTLVML